MDGWITVGYFDDENNVTSSYFPDAFPLCSVITTLPVFQHFNQYHLNWVQTLRGHWIIQILIIAHNLLQSKQSFAILIRLMLQ